MASALSDHASSYAPVIMPSLSAVVIVPPFKIFGVTDDTLISAVVIMLSLSAIVNTIENLYRGVKTYLLMLS